MRKPILLLYKFSGISIPDLLTRARALRDGSIFTDAVKFPSPPTALPGFSALITDLQTKYDAARNRDAIAVAEQDVAEKRLLQAMSALGRYAAPIVYNDQVAIEQAGFEASADETQPAQPLPAPTFTTESLAGGVRLNMGKKGEADAFTAILIKAGTQSSVTMTSEGLKIVGEATIHTDTHPKVTIQNLAPSTRYTVYVIAVNTAGPSPLSDPKDVTTQ